jgi:hypothetical protein
MTGAKEDLDMEMSFSEDKMLSGESVLYLVEGQLDLGDSTMLSL